MSNEKNTKSYIQSRLKSFVYAYHGWKELYKEPNFKIHLFATTAVIVAGIIRQLDAMRWVAIVFAIGLVLVSEALNTCIEKLCDYACKKQPAPEIKNIKDIAAMAVLIAAIISIVIAVLVFRV